jgi:hypothetical protein
MKKTCDVCNYNGSGCGFGWAWLTLGHGRFNERSGTPHEIHRFGG